MALLPRGEAFLNRTLALSAGVTVTYSRGAQSVGLTAWPGRTMFAVSAPADAARVVWGDADWLVPVADLVLGGETTRPARGDRITAVLAGESCVFEVVTPTGEQTWRYSDPTLTRYRIHCKRVA